MPNANTGFTGDEIISFVQGFIGNNDSSFSSFLSSSLALAEFRFCKMHDWRFLRKQNLSLTVVSGTSEYTLNSGSIGYYMQAEHIHRVFSVANNKYLSRVTLDEIRQLDADQNGGNSTAKLQYWAPVGDNTIVVWPPTFADTTLKIDGKITPSALLTTSNYPTIPYHYQDSFIEFVKAVALERENDDRASRKMADALALIQQDIQNDQSQLANSGQPRFRSQFESAEAVASSEWDALNMLRPE